MNAIGKIGVDYYLNVAMPTLNTLNIKIQKDDNLKERHILIKQYDKKGRIVNSVECVGKNFDKKQ